MATITAKYLINILENFSSPFTTITSWCYSCYTKTRFGLWQKVLNMN